MPLKTKTLRVIKSGLLIVNLVAIMCVVTSCGGSAQGDAITNMTQTQWPARDITFAQCMVIAARAAYADADTKTAICDELLTEPFEYMPDHSTDVLKIFKRRINRLGSDHVEVIISFAGTRATDIGDILRDIQSQIPKDYENYLGAPHNNAQSLKGDERTGAGFDRRWENHANTVQNALQLIETESQQLALLPATTITLVGHSLGAAVAARAAFDLNRTIEGQRIVLWSFNSPRIGNSAFADSFTASLKKCGNLDQGCFMIRKFSRSTDIVHDVPLLLSQTLWNTEQDIDLRTKLGEASDRDLGYCPQYHAPRASLFELGKNHKLDTWVTDLDEMPADHLNCMFQ